MLVYVPVSCIFEEESSHQLSTRHSSPNPSFWQFMEDMNVYYSSIMTVHIPAKVILCFITKESIAQYNQPIFLDEHTKPLTVKQRGLCYTSA
jgi:hypothetical protein